MRSWWNGTNLWCQVESQIASASQTVLDQEGHLVRQADLDSVGQGLGFAEVDEILEREGQGNGLGELNLDVVLLLLDVLVAAQGDRAVSNVAVGGELDAVLGCLNGD